MPKHELWAKISYRLNDGLPESWKFVEYNHSMNFQDLSFKSIDGAASLPSLACLHIQDRFFRCDGVKEVMIMTSDTLRS